MPEFQRKGLMFAHRGMNWNAPVEKLPDGQVPWAKNVRVLEQGTISSAHGHTQAFPGYSLGDQYLHSISRLNVLNPAFDPNLRRTYVMGGDTILHVFQDGPTLTNSTLNPVSTPLGQYLDPGGHPVFSGNPLSIVDAQPAGAAVAWKYIGDSKQMVTVGYYPSDVAGVSMARCLTMGLTPPVVTTGTPPTAGGNLTGNYQWIFAFRRVPTGARSNPSAATRYAVGASGPTGPVTTPAIPLTNEYVTMTLPTSPADPQTGSPDVSVVVDVYRFGGTVFRWALVGSGAGGSTFVDNKPDIELLAAPSPPQVTDASTGLTRFNLYRPFVTQDIGRSGTASVSRLGNGAWVLTQVSGALFNPNWLPGSTINVFGMAFTIYQVQLTSLELSEDATFKLLEGSTYSWNTPAGTLTAGQPVDHLWGPYGIGQQGSYVFGCGDQNALGTLYWTNGNDPDSTDIVNNIQVTSPSEKLQTGCLYDGQPYCWSTERQFVIAPSLTVFGQFTAQEVAGGKGCWLEWSLSVQSNGFADQSVTWRGKDGIYDWSSAGWQRLSDPLYAFFPHDNHPGIAPETIMPFIGVNSEHPESVGNLDDTQAKYHRTCWFQGVLFYDFVALTQPAGGPAVSTFSTLVWDSINVNGWVSLDQVFPDTLHPVARSVEIGANDLQAHDADVPAGLPLGATGPAGRGGNLKVTWGGTIYDYQGYNRGFEARVITRAEDLGDSRAPKLWGDYWFDCSPVSAITVVPLLNFNLANIAPNTIPAGTAPVARTQFVLDFFGTAIAGGKGLLNNTLGLDVRWIAANGQYVTSINQWQPSFVVKPEVLEFRASDRSDEGAVQAKYLMGMNMEANTNIGNLTTSPSFVLNVIVDGVVTAQLSVNHDGQTEKPYAWTPVAGYEFQVQMSYPQNVEWQLFKISWIFQVWPDAVARTYPFQDLGTSQVKYIRQIVLPIETAGAIGQVGVVGDDGHPLRTFGGLTTAALAKTDVPLVLEPPMIAHEIQFSTLSPMRIWPSEVKVDFELWPELSNERSAFTDCGYKGAKYMEGANIAVDTNGQAIRFEVHWENGVTTLGPVTTPAGVKTLMPFSFGSGNLGGPFAAEELQIIPLANCRIWYDEINWVFTPWPEAIAITYPFQDLGTAGAKYIKGIVLPMETGATLGTVGLWADDGGGLRTYSNLTTPNLKKEGIVIPLAGPITAHEIQFSTLSPMRIWPSEVKVDFDPYPEFSSEVSSFTDCGYKGSKFMQGAIIPMDTGGQPVQLKIVFDKCFSQSVTLPATTTQTGCKSPMAFSFSPCNAPPSDAFIAMEVQVQPQSSARIWYDEIQWIFEPAPELADSWVTQPTNHDLPGWHSLRDCYIAYQGGSGAPMLTITTEYGSLSYTLDTVSPGRYVRCYRVLDPQKARWRSYRVEGCGALRLYKKDCEVRVKAWGSTGPYMSALPFGGPSRVDGARI